ncbi:MAG: hypothetical protein ACK6D3_13830 [Planctomycetaceae bacterium]
MLLNLRVVSRWVLPCAMVLVGFASQLEAGLWRLTYNDGTTQLTADLVSQPNNATSEWVVSGTLNVTSGPLVGSYTLYPLGPGGTDTGGFTGNNLIYPTSDPVVDSSGLVWQGNGLEVNLWGNSPGNYSFYSWNGATYTHGYDGNATVTLTAIPEPSTALIAGAGVLCLLARKLARRRTGVTA